MMVEDAEIQEVPFDMSKETLKSIRIWIDKITELSIGIISGERIEPNDMIVIKHRMIKQLIILSAPLLKEDDLNEIEEFFSKIKLDIGRVKLNKGWNNNAPMYTKETDYELDECLQGVEIALKKYFIPTFTKGEKY